MTADIHLSPNRHSCKTLRWAEVWASDAYVTAKCPFFSKGKAIELKGDIMNNPQEPNTIDSDVEAYQEPNTEAIQEPNTESIQEPNTESIQQEPNTGN
jgi:hypothetical protein